MSNECLVLVGSEIPKNPYGFGGTSLAKGVVRGSVQLVWTRDMKTAADALAVAEERLKADAGARGANVVTNLKVVDLHFGTSDHLLVVGDAWYAGYLKEGRSPSTARCGGIR